MSNFSGEPEFIQLRVDPNERKVPVSVSFSPAKYAIINKLVPLGSFSSKIELIITEWLTISSKLVVYEDEEQRENREPTIINALAEKIFTCSEEETGWNLTNNKYLPVIKKIMKDIGYRYPHYPKSEQLVKSKVIPILREHLLVQVIDEIEYDLYEVWVCPIVTADSTDCKKCNVIDNIMEYLKRLQED